MNQAFEKMKMLVGVEADEEHQATTATMDDGSSSWFMDDFNRNCTLSTKQVSFLGSYFDSLVAEFSVGNQWFDLYLPFIVLYYI